MRWDETWRSLGPQMLDEMGRLTIADQSAWLQYWRQRALPYPEFVRLLWRMAVTPRESEAEAYLNDIADIGLLIENLVRHPDDTGWGIAEDLFARLLRRRGPFLESSSLIEENMGLEQAWMAKRPDVAEQEARNVIHREGLSGLMERLVKQPIQRDVGGILPSLWRVSGDLASYWAGEDPWSLMRLACRWQAMAADKAPVQGLAGWTVEEGDVTRPLDFLRYFQSILQEHLPSIASANPDQALTQVYDDGHIQSLLQYFARVSLSLKTQDLRWLIAELMVDALGTVSPSMWEFFSRQTVGVIDLMTLSTAHRSAGEERHLVWSAWAWGIAAMSVAGYRIAPAIPRGTSRYPVEDLWVAMEHADVEASYALAAGLGDAVRELWPLLREEATVLGNPVAIRAVAAAQAARRLAPPMAGHRLLPAVVSLMAGVRTADLVGDVGRSRSVKRPK